MPEHGWWTLPYQFRKRFYFVRPLGRGGMGAVFLAVDDDVPGRERRVAVKVAQANPRIQGMLKMLFRLERAQAGVLAGKYPQFFVGVQGWDNSDPPYLALEYLDPRDGWQTLGDFLALHHSGSDSTLDSAVVTQIGIALLRGVEAMARCRVVHRDLKPDNIFLRSIGAGYEVKIGDLGVACDERVATSGFDAEGSVQTIVSTPALAGTVQYMSPEHMEGDKLSCQSDIHTVGSILWEVATGKVPYPEGQNRVERLTRVPERPASMSEPLYAVIARALSYEPEERWQRDGDPKPAARAMREELKRLVSASAHESRTRELMGLLAALRPWADLRRDASSALEKASFDPSKAEESIAALKARHSELMREARLAQQATVLPEIVGDDGADRLSLPPLEDEEGAAVAAEAESDPAVEPMPESVSGHWDDESRTRQLARQFLDRLVPDAGEPEPAAPEPEPPRREPEQEGRRVDAPRKPAAVPSPSLLHSAKSWASTAPMWKVIGVVIVVTAPVVGLIAYLMPGLFGGPGTTSVQASEVAPPAVGEAKADSHPASGTSAGIQSLKDGSNPQGSATVTDNATKPTPSSRVVPPVKAQPRSPAPAPVAPAPAPRPEAAPRVSPPAPVSPRPASPALPSTATVPQPAPAAAPARSSTDG